MVGGGNRTRARLVDRVKDIVADQPSLISAALSFCTSFNAVSTVIPGATSEEQLIANIDAMRHPLPAELRGALGTFTARRCGRCDCPGKSARYLR